MAALIHAQAAEDERQMRRIHYQTDDTRAIACLTQRFPNRKIAQGAFQRLLQHVDGQRQPRPSSSASLAVAP